MAWVQAINRSSITFERTAGHMHVCSRHFITGKPAYEMMTRNPDWVPSLNLGYEVSTMATFNQFSYSSRSKQQPQIVPHNTGSETEVVKATDLNTAPSTTATVEVKQEQISDEKEKKCSLSLKEMEQQPDKNKKLKREVSKNNLSEDFLKDNDLKVTLYTGLPSSTLLMDVLMQIRPSLPHADRRMSHFQMLLLTLMHLTQNLPLNHIARLFDISLTSTSFLFKKTINALYVHFSPSVRFPQRQCVSDCATVIIECFELCIKRAQHLHTKTKKYSRYKRGHLMKYLIGITTQRTVSFVSKGWGGRVTNKHIAENSGFLHKLSPGDVVWANQTFDIKESVALMGATLENPAFAQGQLKGKDNMATREQAHVKIQRVIECIRSKYSILKNAIDLGLAVSCEGEDMTLLDKIVTVSCALTNMCPSAE